MARHVLRIVGKIDWAPEGYLDDTIMEVGPHAAVGGSRFDTIQLVNIELRSPGDVMAFADWLHEKATRFPPGAK